MESFRRFSGRLHWEQPAVLVAGDSSQLAVSEGLERALREIVRTQRALLGACDTASFRRFGEAAQGVEMIGALGYALATDQEALIVDQLRWFPDATALIREYLDACRVPQASAVERFRAIARARRQSGDAGPTPRQGVKDEGSPARARGRS